MAIAHCLSSDLQAFHALILALFSTLLFSGEVAERGLNVVEALGSTLSAGAARARGAVGRLFAAVQAPQLVDNVRRLADASPGENGRDLGRFLQAEDGSLILSGFLHNSADSWTRGRGASGGRGRRSRRRCQAAARGAGRSSIDHL